MADIVPPAITDVPEHDDIPIRAGGQNHILLALLRSRRKTAHQSLLRHEKNWRNVLYRPYVPGLSFSPGRPRRSYAESAAGAISIRFTREECAGRIDAAFFEVALSRGLAI